MNKYQFSQYRILSTETKKRYLVLSSQYSVLITPYLITYSPASTPTFPNVHGYPMHNKESTG
jgi:hypothetical protein